jgi:hypothetical protein
MATKWRESIRPALRPEELEAQALAELPGRAALSLVNANLAIPVNLALAANILSDNAGALAGAVQDTPINQGMLGLNPLGR